MTYFASEMKYLEITGLPISQDLSMGYCYPAASLAQQLTTPVDEVELRFFTENKHLHCYLGIPETYIQGAVSELQRSGYSVETVKGKVESKHTQHILTRELRVRAEVIPNSVPKFSYDVPHIENPSFRSNSLYDFLSKCDNGSGFSILFGPSQLLDLSLSNRLMQANSEADSVIGHMLSESKLFPAVVCPFSDNAKHAELIAKALCYVFGGLTCKTVTPQKIGTALLTLQNDDPKVRLIGKLHTLYTAEEINTLADLTGTRCDNGLPYNKDSIVSRNTSENLPKAELKIGKDTQGKWIGIPFKTVSRHMFIGGAPRTGKGNLLTSIAFQLAKANIPFLMIESAKLELHHLRKVIPSLNVWRPDNGQYVLNPFALPDDISLDEYRASLNNIMRLSFNLEGSLVELSKTALQNCFSKNGFSGTSTNSEDTVTLFGMNEFLTEYRFLLEHNGYSVKTEQDMKTCGLNRMQSLLTDNKSVFDSIRSIPLSQLLNGFNLLQLNSLSTLESKQLFATILLISLSSWLKLRMRNKNNVGLQLAVMIDESHNLLKSVTNSNGVEFSFARDFEALLLEMSALGVGFIIADQSSSNLPTGMVDICATKIFLGGNRYSGIEAYKSMMGLDETSLQNLYRLGPGEGIFYSDGMPVAKVFQSPNVSAYFDVNKEYETKNDFLQQNPRFTIETFQECAKCPYRGKCNKNIKSQADSISTALFSQYGHMLHLVDIEENKDKKRALQNQFIGSLAKATVKYDDDLLCCSMIQVIRLCNRWHKTRLDASKAIDVIRKWRKVNGY